MLMLFMTNFNKRYTIIDSVLKIDYAYLFKNLKQTKISYKFEGYLLLLVFIWKIGRVGV